MIHLHTLGPLDLRDSDGREIGAVLRQPKRLALLAYLAVSSPRRFHRRDSLLALFWPDLDQEHARAALRRAIYFLRGELGADVVSGRGDEELAVPDAEFWCDAAALDSALAGGDPAGALELYRGPLLDGLYVAGAASEFQDWLDRERARLADRAGAAARALAETAVREGRVGDAAEWARRGLALAPTDEAALRRCITLLERSGDAVGALRAYDDFARRLAHDLELEPSKETHVLADAVRARAEHTGRAGVTAEAGTAATAPTSPATIAVLPFAVRGDPRFAYLGEGMVDLLATKLDGAGEIRTVDPRALLLALQRDPDAPRRLGAGRCLAGSVVEAGGRLQVTATLYDLDQHPVASVQATADDEDQIFDVVDELALQLLAAQGVSPGTRLTRIAARTTASLDALKAYLTGEHELRAGRNFDAMEHFQSAVDADGSFALAYYRLAAAAAGCALPDQARDAAERGAGHQERLSPHDHLMFAAQRAWLRGEVGSAEPLYNTITGTYPDDLEAWFHLGDLLYHTNPLRGRSAVEAREAFERVLRLEPEHVGALLHLVRIAAIGGRTDEMLARIDQVLRVSPDGDQVLAMRALRAWTTHDAGAIAGVKAELQHARALTVAIAFADVALYAGDLGGAGEIARGFLQVARAPELRALCHIMLAHLALAAGDPDAARAELREAEAHDRTWGVEMRALFAVLPSGGASEAEIRHAHAALEALDPSESAPSSFIVFAMHQDLHPAIRTYLLGLLELRLGDVSAAADRLEEIAELEAGGPLVPRNLTVDLDAALTRARGRPSEALSKLERARPELWYQLTVGSPFFTLASQRYLRAQLLEELGRPEEAAGWYRSIAERSPYEMIWRKGVKA